jgi:hypothetical protein
LVYVDGTDFRIRMRKPFEKCWWSHKFKGAGLRYEVATSIQSGEIVWTNGPFLPGDFPDISIFRRDLIYKLDDDEKVEADLGYRGEPSFIRLPDKTREQQMVSARHETCNGRFKQWGALSQHFRHATAKHSWVFQAVVVITQLEIENGEPLFNVEY